MKDDRTITEINSRAAMLVPLSITRRRVNRTLGMFGNYEVGT